MNTSNSAAGHDPATYFAARYEAVRANVSRALSGKPEAVRLALTCFFAGGHLLVEDVPGVGKTTLAKAIAASLDASWHRIQFTPDLLPSDITGTNVYDQRTGTFEFRPGPAFAHLVLADEINRASPKTQSALLEVMEERQVTVDGRSYPVPAPFLVVATQNPVDLAGTYRLPEAQLDRFLLRISVGYPDVAAERDILVGRAREGGAPELSPVASVEQVRWMIEYVSRVHVADAVAEYVARIAEATRRDPRLRLGASPRGSLALVRAAQSWAAGQGRGYVVPDDVKAVAEPVLGHRLLLASTTEIEGGSADDVLRDVLGTVPVPLAARV
ncbi:MoxR-like ATPase [Micromonospora pallida]|uniref:MoxR-like ATPase n=1 Tax=Micromonospora pallida TaxID=145854 RepID=A0A1C6T5G6_9ACTN|nr:MoxR family ATPase [Micromonospora pallida]SCL37060.1 MoxR-like ATPase [Micromonospora pallida]